MSLDAVCALERGITAPTIDSAGRLIAALEIDANDVFKGRQTTLPRSTQARAD